jgi:hypothetical protein
MSETKKTTAYTVAPESIISLDVSGHFYKRLTALYFNLVKKIEPEDFEKISIALNESTVDKLESEQNKMDAHSLETMLVLMGNIELKFKEGDFIKKQDVEIPISD